MLGQVNPRSSSASGPSRSGADASLPLSPGFSDPLPLPSSTLQLGIGSFPPFGLKSDTGVDTVATRQASLVASEHEPEHEHDSLLALDPAVPDATKSDYHVIKRRNVGVPKFLRFLFQILEVENPNIIAWSHDGTAFQIIDPEALATQILPRYFKHNKVSSFQRQLNYFGFKKWTKTQTNICTFSHPFFLQSEKDRMKLIKRKERATSVILSPLIKPNSIERFQQLRVHAGQREDSFEPHDLAHARTQLPMQQALKRQKSTTLSGATVTFLNSAAAGRRHSTGMLPNSDAFGLAAAAVAAASSPGQKRAGTPAEQELELELEARSEARAAATSTQQHFWYLQQLAKAKQLAQRTSYQVARGGSGGVHVMNVGRRKSEQLGAGKPLSTNPIDDFLATSPSLTNFPSTGKTDASMVQPVSSTGLYPDAAFQVQHEQRQQEQQLRIREQMNRHAGYRAGAGYGSKTESCTGWLSSTTVYHSQVPQSPLMMQSKFGEFNAMDYSTFSANGRRPSHRLQSPPYQPHHERIPWFQPQEQPRQQHDRHEATQPHPARDYIDVLLESAALDENLPLQTSTSLSADAWHEATYAHNSDGPHSHGTYPHHPDQHSHLASMDLPHAFNSRF